MKRTLRCMALAGLLLAACSRGDEAPPDAREMTEAPQSAEAQPPPARPERAVEEAIVSTDTGAAEASADAAAVSAPPQTAPAIARPEEVVFQTYRNERFGYTIDYPANVMRPRGELGRGHGREFSTEDGSASLLVYAVGNSSPQTLQARYTDEVQNPDQEVTYNVLREDWFVVSGFRNGRVFYQRAGLEGDLLRIFRIEYDRAEKPFFDSITEHISFSF